MARAGIEVSGFDISKEMVRKSKAMLNNYGLNADNIIWRYPRSNNLC
ncbi:class I SAM-dependent methyltransferase [Legionella pneumophila]|nr:class I SAM-dependent methyltransferase [Legionella pneumophila]